MRTELEVLETCKAVEEEYRADIERITKEMEASLMKIGTRDPHIRIKTHELVRELRELKKHFLQKSC